MFIDTNNVHTIRNNTKSPLQLSTVIELKNLNYNRIRQAIFISFIDDILPETHLRAHSTKATEVLEPF